jgi:hypothetical protein
MESNGKVNAITIIGKISNLDEPNELNLRNYDNVFNLNLDKVDKDRVIKENKGNNYLVNGALAKSESGKHYIIVEHITEMQTSNDINLFNGISITGIIIHINSFFFILKTDLGNFKIKTISHTKKLKSLNYNSILETSQKVFIYGKLENGYILASSIIKNENNSSDNDILFTEKKQINKG